MFYKLQTTQQPDLERIYEEILDELGEFFQFRWIKNRPRVFILPDRATMNELKGREVPPWIVAWTGKTDIYILEPESYGKSSGHTYTPENYLQTLKHELVHCFTNVVTGFAQEPLWLIEGLAIYLSGQLNQKKRPEKLRRFLQQQKDHRDDPNIYAESGFAVEFLIEKYGQEKLLTLLKKMKDSDHRYNFLKLFKEIYGFEMEYENFGII